MSQRAKLAKYLIDHYRESRDPVNEFPGRNLAFEPSLAQVASRQVGREAIARQVQKYMPADPRHVSFGEKCGLFTIGVPIGLFTALYFLRGRS